MFNVPCPIPTIERALQIVRSAWGKGKEAEVLHIHLVGDAKAGKSVAAKWLIDLFAENKRLYRRKADLEFAHSNQSNTRRYNRRFKHGNRSHST